MLLRLCIMDFCNKFPLFLLRTEAGPGKLVCRGSLEFEIMEITECVLYYIYITHVL